MPVRTQVHATTLVLWECDWCGVIDVQVNPTGGERVAGLPGWQRLQAGTVTCPEHAAVGG